MNLLEIEIQRQIDEEIIKECPTLKAFAEALGLKPVQLYTVAKKPMPDKVYDSRVYNWDAIYKYVLTKFDPDVGIGNIEDLVRAAAEKDMEFSKSDRRRKEKIPKVKTADGKVVPAVKFKIEVGDEVMLKDSEKPYTVVYMTTTHVVLKQENLEKLYCYQNSTLNGRLV